MPGNNIDSLQIQIFSSTTQAQNAIGDLIKELDRLKKALYADTDTTVATQNLGKMVSGFERLTQAASKLDISALKAANKEIVNFSKKMSGRNLYYTEAQKGQIEDARQGIKSIAKEREKLFSALPAKNFISEQTIKELGDYERVKAAFGGRLVKGDENKSVLSFFEGYEKTGLDAAYHYSEMLNNVADRLLTLTAREEDYRKKIEQVHREAAGERTDLTGLVDENAIANMDRVADTSQRVATIGETAGQSLQALAGGMSDLQGMNLTAEQFSGVGSLTKLATGLSGASSENLTSSLNAIANGLTKLAGIPTTNSDALMQTANAVNRFGYSSSDKAGNNIVAVANGLTQLAGVDTANINAENLVSLGNAVGKFGSAGAQRATTTLPMLADGFRQLMTTLSNAPQVSESTIRLAEAMSQMSQRAAGISNAVNRAGNGLNLFGRTAHRTRFHIGSLAAVFGSLYANFFLLIRGARLAGKAIEYSSQMTEAMNVVDVAYGKSADKIKDFMTDSIKQFGLGRLAAAQYSSRFQMMAKTMGISADEVAKANDFIQTKTEGNALAYDNLGDSVADMSINLTKLTADMASLYNQDYDSVAADMQSVLTGMTRPLRKYGIDLSVASMKEFALKNGLDADISSMTQAEKTLLRYQMVMTQASGAMGDFQKTADTWANSMRTVKQLLQEFGRILGEAFIQAFKPALIAFRNFMYNMLTLTQSALNAVGKLLGWEKIDFGGAALAEDMEEYADAIDDAAGSAKKLKGQLRGIDELNNLTTNPNGGGGGGADAVGSALGTDLWEQIKETHEKYKSEINSWFEFGRAIADKIQEGFESIDWDEIKKNAAEGARNFASFLNGLFKPEMFYEGGKAIAEGLNTGLTWLYNFADEFDFENFGVSLREGFKGFLENFDWELLGENINKWVHGFMDFLKGLFGDKKLWKDMFESAIKLIGTLDLSTLEILCLVPTLVFGASAVRGALVSAITTALGETPLALPAIAVSIAGGLLIGNGAGQIYAALTGNDDMLHEYQSQNPFTNDSQLSKIAEAWFDDWYNKGLWTNLGTKLGNLIGEIIVHAIDAGKWLNDAFLVIVDSFKTIFKRASDSLQAKELLGLGHSKGGGLANDFDASDYLYEIGKNIVKGIKEGIDRQLSKTKYGNVFKSIFDGICKVFGIQSPAKEMYPVGENIILGIIEGFSLVNFAAKISEWWNKNVAPWFTVAKWSAIANNIKTAIIGKWNETSNLWGVNITNWWNTKVSPWFTLDKWKGIADNIRAGIVAKWNELLVWFTGASNGLVNTAKAILSFTEFANIGNAIGSGLESAFSPYIEAMIGMWEKLKALVSSGLSMVVNIVADKSGFDNALNGLGGQVQETQELIEELKKLEKENNKNNLANKGAVVSTQKQTYSNKGYVYTTGNGQTKKYASGGFPSVGSLFLAGESGAGAELVGNINGKTGVVSNQEISGIRAAIVETASAEVQLLRQQNVLLQGILQKEFGIASDDLFRSVRKSANEYFMSTGNPAFN